jgi:hypothetical protein
MATPTPDSLVTIAREFAGRSNPCSLGASWIAMSAWRVANDLDLLCRELPAGDHRSQLEKCRKHATVLCLMLKVALDPDEMNIRLSTDSK